MLVFVVRCKAMFSYNPGSLFSTMLTGGAGTGRQQSRPWDSTALPCTSPRVWTVCGVRPGEQNTASARREGEGAEQQALVAQNGSVG